MKVYRLKIQKNENNYFVNGLCLTDSEFKEFKKTNKKIKINSLIRLAFKMLYKSRKLA